MDDLAKFLYDRYTEERTSEESRRSISGNLGFHWTHVFKPDDEHIRLDGGRRVPVDEFYKKYGEPAADPDVLTGLDAKWQLLTEFHPVLKQTDATINGEWNSDGDLAGQLLSYLALPYAQHPEYRGEWRP